MAFPKIDGYVVTEKLGSGSYSTVYKAYTKVGARSVVAIKCVDKSRVKHSGAAVDNLVTEIRLLKTLTHPHIVQMKQFTWDDRNIYIIMEYCCGGDLSKYIRRYGRVPERQVLYFLQQLASALKFLREKGVVHMDLKPHNLLLHKGSDGKYILKVADFGFAQHMAGRTGCGVRGSPLYMAPEVLRGQYTPAIDLWSVGVIMYECLFGAAPYSSRSLAELVDKLRSHAPIHIPASPPVSPDCRSLLVSLLQCDPQRRISYDEFFKHQYLDLEHMPSKENYDKAVQLLQQAVSQDAARRLQSALQSYTRALRLLVPAAALEPDPLRRQALRDKLARYMDRAEEIKRLLQQGDGEPPLTAGAGPPRAAVGGPDTAPRGSPPSLGACCRSQASATSDDLYEITQYLTSRESPMENAHAHEDQVPEEGIQEHTGRVEQPGGAAGGPERGPAPPGGAKHALKRLFSRSSPTTLLDDTNESGARQRTDDDGCRIT